MRAGLLAALLGLLLGGCARSPHLREGRVGPPAAAVIRDVLVSRTGGGALVQVAKSTDPRSGADPPLYWLVEFPEGRAVRFSEPAAGGTIAWSPDGRCIAYADEGGHLRLYEFGQGRRRPLASGDLSCHGLAWSPDGMRVAFEAAQTARASEGERVTTSLYSVAADGRSPARREADGVTGWLWSADGKHLLYASSRPPAGARGSLARALPAGVAWVHHAPGFGPEGVWSPDRSKLAGEWLEARPDSPVTVLDSTLRPLVRAPTGAELVHSLVWSPDSREVIFPKVDAKGGKSGLCVIDVPGRSVKIVQNPGLEQARPVGWVKWREGPRLLLIDGSGRRLLLVAGLQAPAYTLAHVQEDGSLAFDLRPSVGRRKQ